jgi:hypothetical protein
MGRRVVGLITLTEVLQRLLPTAMAEVERGESE